MKRRIRIILKFLVVMAFMAAIGFGVGTLTSLLMYGNPTWQLTGDVPKLPAVVGAIFMLITVFFGMRWVTMTEKVRNRAER